MRSKKLTRIGLALALGAGLLVMVTALLVPPSAVRAAGPPWYARGDFNGWATTDHMYDDGTHGDVTASDGIYSVVVTPTTASRYKWKVDDGNWTESYPSSDAWLITTQANQPVLLTFDTNTYTDGWSPGNKIVNALDSNHTWVAVGDWQEWNNASPTTTMTLVGSYYQYTTYISDTGTHYYKTVYSGTWDAIGPQGSSGGRSTNADNLAFNTTYPQQKVTFYADPTTGRIRTYVLEPVVINELDADQTGTDSAEFIELYDGGQGNTLLDGLVVVLFNGNGDVSYNAFDLDGYTTGGDGYFVICGDAANVPNCDLDVSPDTNLIQNGADAATLYISDASDFPNGTAVTNTNLVDAIVYDTDDSDDAGLLSVLLNPGQPQVNERDGGSGTTHSNQRCPNGSGGLRNTDTYIQETPTSGATNNCRPDVVIDKTGPTLATPGDFVTYTVTYANDGTDYAHNVIISDTLPIGVSYVSDDSGLSCPACSVGATGTLTWSVDTITPTGNFSFIFTGWITGSVPFGSVLTNTVEIATSDAEITTTNNSGQWATSISALDLVVDKVGPNCAVIGENIVYTITLNNVGVTTATNTILTDTLPVSTTYVFDNSGVVHSNPIPGVYVWSFGDVLSNTLYTFNLTVTVNSGVTGGAVLTNTVEASTDTTGDNPTNNTAQWETTTYPLVSIHDIQYVDESVGGTFPSDLLGQMVYVEGMVVAESGEVNNNNTYVIEDPTGGPWSGLEIYTYGDQPSVNEGDYVGLLGRVDEHYGMTQLNVGSSVGGRQTVLSTTNPLPAPEVLATNDFATGNNYSAEAYESVLIEFQNATVTDEDLGYGEWEFNDGSGPTIADDAGDTDGDQTYVPELDDVYNFIRGIGWYSFDDYKLQPRYNADIALHMDAPIITKDAPAIVTAGTLFTYTITVENDLGYTLTGLTITDVVPANATFAYALDGGVESGSVVTWTATSLPSGNSLSMRFAVTATGTTGDEIWNDTYAAWATNWITPTTGSPLLTFIGDYVPIYTIQGSGFTSPYDGQQVRTVGVVVGFFEGNYPGSGAFDGFYIQDTAGDTITSTSDAVFVNHGTAAVSVAVGDLVTVTGTVGEFSEYDGTACTGDACLTQIAVSGASDVEVGSNVTLPTAIELAPPGGDVVIAATYWESLEGMLVTIPNTATVVGPTSYNTIMVVRGDLGVERVLRTGPHAGMPVAVRHYKRNGKLDDGSYPDNLIVGSTVENVDGPLAYSYGTYLVATQAGDVWTTVYDKPAPTTVPSWPAAPTEQFSAATFNVYNYHSGATKLTKVVSTVVGMGAPTFLALEEINVAAVITDVINALDAQGYPYAYAYSHPDVGGHGVAVLWRTDRVTDVAWSTEYQGCSADGSSSSTYDPLWDTCRASGEYPLFSRRPVVVTGTVTYDGNATRVVVIGNHFKSKSGDDPSATQRRLEQAQFVAGLVDGFVTTVPNILVLGDLNDFEDSPPLEALYASGNLTNTWYTLPEEARYSYIYQGTSQILDHILASPALFTWLDSMSPMHYNADFPYYPYSNDNSVVWRTSDHDTIVATFTLPRYIYLPLVLRNSP